jgi:hypothetical protein
MALMYCTIGFIPEVRSLGRPPAKLDERIEGPEADPPSRVDLEWYVAILFGPSGAD